MIQVGAGGIKSLAGSHTVMSMDAILESLVGKARVEAEESQRLLLAALNGIAGLMILQEENAEAVAVYRQALNLGKSHAPPMPNQIPDDSLRGFSVFVQ